MRIPISNSEVICSNIQGFEYEYEREYLVWPLGKTDFKEKIIAITCISFLSIPVVYLGPSRNPFQKDISTQAVYVMNCLIHSSMRYWIRYLLLLYLKPLGFILINLILNLHTIIMAKTWTLCVD